VVTGKRKEYVGPDAPLVDLVEESLPAKYHSASELKYEVKSGGNSKDWEVESIRRKK
jgi:hypothetical protein